MGAVMESQVHWDKENRLVFVILGSVQTLDEVEDIYARILDHLEEAGERLDVIVDYRNVERITFTPNEIIGVHTAREARTHPNMGWTVYINEGDLLLNLMANMMGQSTQSSVKIVKSEEEAIAFLEQTG
jgi:hypothetical protein